MQTQNNSLSIPVANWAIWNNCGSKSDLGAPDVSFIEPMLRRRLSPLARTALHTAHACAGDLASVRFVYASRHGELNRTLELLCSLSSHEALSPTTFGLSVLNASAGIYSIARGDTASATAVAAGPETFAFGLIEAGIRALTESGPPVLYVYADAPIPMPFGPLADDPCENLAAAFLIDPQCAKRRLVCEWAPASAPASCESLPAAFLNGINQGIPVGWNSDQRNWKWTWQ